MTKGRTNWISALTVTMLGYVGAARADIVIVVSANSSTKSLSAEMVSQIFLGKSNLVTPIDNGGKSGIRAEFYSKVAGKSEAQVRAIWSRIVFTGKGMPPKELHSDEEVMKAVAADPNAIGYVDKAVVDGSVRIVLQVK